MMEIAGRPLLEHTLCWLKVHGIEEVAVNLHHAPSSLIRRFGSGSGLGARIVYSYEREVLGSAGAVKKLERFLGERFLVVYGDLLTRMDLRPLIEFHIEKRALVTIATYDVDNPAACGLVEADGGGRVVRFVEKPSPGEAFTNQANAGIYLVEPETLAHIPPDAFFDFGADLFPLLLSLDLRLFAFPLASNSLIDAGTFRNLARARQMASEWGLCA